jgi:ABC-type proline/glycine betaine transport system permease subunit
MLINQLVNPVSVVPSIALFELHMGMAGRMIGTKWSV